jgi:hypothetical protein
MDLSFFQRAERHLAAVAPARADFGLLCAMLQAHQQSSAAARIHALRAGTRQVRDPIAEILLAGPGWRGAVAALGGSFNPALARKRAVN